MAKRIKSRKSKDSGYDFLISANLDQKKLIKNIQKSILNSLKKENTLIPLNRLSVTVNGIKKITPNYWKLATIFLSLFSIIGLIFFVKFFSYENLSPVSQNSSTKFITITPTLYPTSTPTPRIINHKINILILNASRYQGIALKLKTSLTQNKFENIIIGNSKQILDSVLIEYKPGCEFEAKYLKENYIGLSNSILSQLKNTNSTNDIIITLGKSYISK